MKRRTVAPTGKDIDESKKSEESNNRLAARYLEVQRLREQVLKAESDRHSR
jgi:hypothetical protein